MTKTTSVRNTHKVDRDVWRKWNAEHRALFNTMFQNILNLGPDLFLHPVTRQRNLTDDEFRTIAWNAAWEAVSVLRKEVATEVVTLHEGRVIAVDPVKKRAA